MTKETIKLLPLAAVGILIGAVEYALYPHQENRVRNVGKAVMARIEYWSNNNV